MRARKKVSYAHASLNHLRNIVNIFSCLSHVLSQHNTFLFQHVEDKVFAKPTSESISQIDSKEIKDILHEYSNHKLLSINILSNYILHSSQIVYLSLNV